MITVTRIEQDQDITPPAGHHLSVLLKMVAREDGVNDQPGKRYYVCWLLAGRENAARFAVPRYAHDARHTVRCDLPNDTPMSHAGLLKALNDFIYSESTQPPDTPVIRGLV